MSQFMNSTQDSTAWQLPAGTARRLQASPTARLLRVVEGRVWLTRSGRLEDCWLAAGERAALAPGEEVVVEGWPRARFELLQAAPALSASRRAGLGSWSRAPAGACPA